MTLVSRKLWQTMNFLRLCAAGIFVVVVELNRFLPKLVSSAYICYTSAY